MDLAETFYASTPKTIKFDATQLFLLDTILALKCNKLPQSLVLKSYSHEGIYHAKAISTGIILS